MPEENNDPINSLPEYKIRTMEDDINKLGEKPINLEKPKSAPVPTPALKPTPTPAPKLKPTPLPPKPLPTKPLPSPIDISPPETLPIVTEKLVTIEAPIVVEKPNIEIKKAPLPGIEDFIIPTPPSPTPTPIKVAVPTIIEPPKPKTFKSERPKRIISPEARKQRTKRILTILIIVLVIIVLGLFFYWQGTRPEPIPTPLPSNKIKIPSSLIPVDETKILKIDNNVSLDSLLRDESLLNQQPGTIKRIVPVNAPGGEEKNILLLGELLKKLEIAVYPYVLSELNDNYNLIIYSQGTEKNIGLIIQTNNPNNVKEQAKYWEATMVDDLKNLFLFKKPGDPTTKLFKDNTYNNIAIRFINFPNPNITIDYAIPGNLFILSTSRESMYSIIDRLK